MSVGDIEWKDTFRALYEWLGDNILNVKWKLL